MTINLFVWPFDMVLNFWDMIKISNCLRWALWCVFLRGKVPMEENPEIFVFSERYGGPWICLCLSVCYKYLVLRDSYLWFWISDCIGIGFSLYSGWHSKSPYLLSGTPFLQHSDLKARSLYLVLVKVKQSLTFIALLFNLDSIHRMGSTKKESKFNLSMKLCFIFEAQ